MNLYFLLAVLLSFVTLAVAEAQTEEELYSADDQQHVVQGNTA